MNFYDQQRISVESNSLPWRGAVEMSSVLSLVLYVRYLINFALISLVCSSSLSAQSLQALYTGLDKATSLSVTQSHIYVVEQGKNRVLKLDLNGKLIDTIGGIGSGDYQFSKPVDVDATNGLKVFVTDFNNRRVQVFDRRGQYLSSISGRDFFGVTRRYNPTQVSVSDMGEVYFVNSDTRSIHHFDLDYNLLDEFRIPNDIESVDELMVASSEIFILDRSLETIHRLALNGSYRGFYTAADVRSMFVDQNGLWKAYADRVESEPKTGKRLEIHFDNRVEPVDMHYQKGTLFILTSERLLKISVPEQ